MSKYVGTYFADKQARRKERSKRRKRVAAGLPAALSLKTMSLSPAHKNMVMMGHTASHQARKKPILTPKHLSLLTALCLHLIAGLIGARYVIQSKAINDDAVTIEMVAAYQVRKKRLMPRRVLKRLETPSTTPQVKVPQPNRPISTAVKIQRGDTQFGLSQSDTALVQLPTASDRDVGLRADALGRDLLVRRRAKIRRAIPKIPPKISFNSSIIGRIESTNLPQPPPDLEALKSPTVHLSDVTQPPRFRHKVAPKYPSLARRAGKEGVVLLEATIGLDSIAREIQVIQRIGYGCDEAAIEALETSRFAPATKGRAKVSVRIKIPYRFSLEQ